MTIFVTYFDFDGTGRFLPLLRRWLEYYQRSACKLPVEILSSVSHAPASHIDGVPVRVVDVREFAAVQRPGNPYDHKSAIICAALPHLPPCVIVDCDVLFLRDPTEELLKFAHEPFAIAPDAGKRRIPMPDGSTIQEESSSVMVFGDNGCTDPQLLRRDLVAGYVRAWAMLSKKDSPHGLVSNIREQRAWSVESHLRRAPVLPRSLNWSRFWQMPPPPEALIYHAHGQSKWAPTQPQPAAASILP